MDIQAFKVFIAVAQEGSQTRAAERLHLTQPAVGLQLKNLQAESGVVLFVRTAQGMRLTPDGAILLRLAENVVSARQEFKATAERMGKQVRGRLSIGTILDPEFTRLGGFLSELLAFGHQIEIALSHGMSGDVIARIQSGEIDAGYSLDPADGVAAETGLARRTLTNFTYRVVAPVGWEPLVAGRDWPALAALPWLGTPPASIHHRLLARVFGTGGIPVPKWIAMVDQEASMLDLVKSGAGLSLVRESIAMREAQAYGLAIADRVSLDCMLGFVCQQGRVDDPVVAAALAAIGKVWRLR